MAANHHLENLVAIVDYNKLQSYGRVDEVLPLDPLADKWSAFGFAVHECDGHDVDALRAAFRALPFASGRPSVLIAHTVKGKGIDVAEGDPRWHHKAAFAAATGDELRAAIKRG